MALLPRPSLVHFTLSEFEFNGRQHSVIFLFGRIDAVDRTPTLPLPKVRQIEQFTPGGQRRKFTSQCAGLAKHILHLARYDGPAKSRLHEFKALGKENSRLKCKADRCRYGAGQTNFQGKLRLPNAQGSTTADLRQVVTRVRQGLKYISGRLVGGAGKRGIRIEFIQPGKPYQSAYIECYNRTV